MKPLFCEYLTPIFSEVSSAVVIFIENNLLIKMLRLMVQTFTNRTTKLYIIKKKIK